MARRSTDPNYGAVHQRRLRAALRAANHGTAGCLNQLMLAAEAAADFIQRRLTDAAKHGCHHCDEGERGTPCRWCGLKVNRRLG